MLYDNVGDIGRPLVGFQGRITENVEVTVLQSRRDVMIVANTSSTFLAPKG
jgi:hypothetical protein